jgi:hypothetical protein
VKAQQAFRRQRLAPHLEEIRQRRRSVEVDDARGIVRPQVGAAACVSDADPRRDHHGQAASEDLEMHTAAALERGNPAGAVDRRLRLVLRAGADRRRWRHALYAIGLVALLAGCGGGSSQPSITVGAAATYHLSGFTPAAAIRAGTPVRVGFTVVQPNGKPLTQFKRGAGPHTGVHLIIVRRDLAVIVHRHPPVGANGRLTDTITFPAPGPYRVVIDVYPKNISCPVPNFQLFSTIRVAGAYRPQPLPAFSPTETVDGVRFTLHGTPRLHAVEPAFLDFTVTDPAGKPATFTPWFGALAHAIFFRKGSLDYFHTHVCAPGASGCTSLIGAAKVTGTSATPGKLSVGVLVPVPGTWRLFLQCRVDGRVVTAPFTLRVS